MDRTGGRGSELGAAMPADGDLAIGAVLQSGGRERREPGADAPPGRAVHAHALLWGAAHGQLAGEARLWGERKAGAAVAAADGTGGDLPQTAAVGARARTPDLPLPTARFEDRSTEPGVGQRHHVHPSAPRVYLSGGDPGLVQSIRCGLGSIGLVGGRLLPGGPGVGTEDGVSGDLQFRSRGAVHQRGFHEAAGGAWDHHQHGWARTGDGQYFCGATVAKREIRRGLSEGLRANVRGRDESSQLLSVLQSRAGSSGLGLSDAGGDLLRQAGGRPRKRKKGSATGRPTERSSFPGDPSARFSCGKRPERKKEQKRKKNPGLWKLTPLMEIRKERGFPQRLEKRPRQERSAFSQFPQARRRRSTLRRTIFCPKNGEHLTALLCRPRLSCCACD